MKRSNMYFFILALLSMISCRRGNSLNETIMKKDKRDSAKVETVDFPSKDGLPVSADIYFADTASPVIVLCHQAGFNKHEYDDIAPVLNSLGFHCMAVDLRSGGALDGKDNITHDRAEKKGLPTDYQAAVQDMEAAIDFAWEKWHKPVILWGSSYSAGLALAIASHNAHVQSVVAFSPGEYFKGKIDVADSVRDLHKPVFATSAEKEVGEVQKILRSMPEGYATQFIPETKGTHGAKCLWSSDPSSRYYWKAVSAWLEKHKEF